MKLPHRHRQACASDIILSNIVSSTNILITWDIKSVTYQAQQCVRSLASVVTRLRPYTISSTPPPSPLNVCLVAESPTCSVAALWGCEGLWPYDYDHARYEYTPPSPVPRARPSFFTRKPSCGCQVAASRPLNPVFADAVVPRAGVHRHRGKLGRLDRVARVLAAPRFFSTRLSLLHFRGFLFRFLIFKPQTLWPVPSSPIRVIFCSPIYFFVVIHLFFPRCKFLALHPPSKAKAHADGGTDYGVDEVHHL